VATIGNELEELAERAVEAKEWTRGLILDAYGSAATEAAAIEANNRICGDAEKEGLVAGRRISPGYPRWPIEQQRALFDALGGAPAGVLLNDHFVMTPRKSISFGVPLGRDLDASSPELGCRYCGMLDCAYRRHEQVPLD
jgi:cobalamin-dependent methionine synthase I